MATVSVIFCLVIWGFLTQVNSQDSIKHKPWCIILDSEYDSPRTWENNEVPYVIAPGFKELPKSLLQNGITSWNEKVRSVKLREKQDGDEDYLNFVPLKRSDVCYSYVGRIGGQQNISLGDYYCYLSIEHLVMHALGFDHEHNRMDRDDYVEVRLNKLPKGYPEHYQKTNRTELNMRAGDYDYYSSMHFPYHIGGLGIKQFKILQDNVDTVLMDLKGGDFGWRDSKRIDDYFGDGDD